MSLNIENYAGSSDFPAIDAGEYEIVLKAEKKTTKDGSKEFINLDFKIRDDVDQKYNNGKTHVFDKAWRDAKNPEWFDLKKLGAILLTQKGLEGYKNEFTEVDEFIQYINGITFRITVDKKYDDYDQKEVNSVRYLSYKPSKHEGPYVEPAKDSASEPVQDTGNAVADNPAHVNEPNLQDSDLPF